jgi:hypothetical protein
MAQSSSLFRHHVLAASSQNHKIGSVMGQSLNRNYNNFELISVIGIYDSVIEKMIIHIPHSIALWHGTYCDEIVNKKIFIYSSYNLLTGIK